MCKGMGGLFPSGASEPGGSAEERSLASEQARIPDGRLQTGALIINADDWGRNRDTTNRTLECVRNGTVSSVSAMVFMDDSQRAASTAVGGGIDAGLHLNFTTHFSAPGAAPALIEHQQRLCGYLRWHRLAQIMFHPGLVRSFEYVVLSQIDEFHRLYGRAPDRLDGHHHMHLCANVLIGRLLPAGTIVRRNFSFRPGEKSFGNRLYRKVVDGALARRHRLTDFFFALPPIEPESRLQSIFSLARQSVVEMETHPINAEEYRFLERGEIFRWTGSTRLVSFRSFFPPCSVVESQLVPS